MHATLSSGWKLIYTVIIDWMEMIGDTPFCDTSEDIADIMEVLVDFDTSEWRTLAMYLRLEDSSMNTIWSNNNDDVLRCLQLAIRDWLRLNYKFEKYGKPSWKKLAKAIKPFNGNIFEKIVSKFPGNNNYYSTLVCFSGA